MTDQEPEVKEETNPASPDSPEKVASQDPAGNYINFKDFQKVEMTIGEILTVEIVEDADKLLRLTVDLGEEEPRQIVSGIREYFEDTQSIVGKKCPFATNLEPRTIRGLESNGMIIAVSDKDGNGFSLLEAGENISPGSKIG